VAWVSSSIADASSSTDGVWREAGRGVCSFIVDSVISAKGVVCRGCRGVASGDSDGCGVGSGGCSSGASGAVETLLLRAALASFTDRRFGAAFFVGDSGSPASLCGGLKICEGSTDSLALVRLAVLGVAAVLAAVLRRGDARVFFGAGVNSSSSLSSCRLIVLLSISELSSSSSTTFLLEAARREGRSGDALDIAIVSFSTTRWLLVWVVVSVHFTRALSRRQTTTMLTRSKPNLV
jgi:hypothetical protein